MNNQVKLLLEMIGGSEFTNGIIGWGYPHHSFAYTNEDMERLSKTTSNDSAHLKAEIDEFKRKLSDLDETDRKLLRDHTMNSFARTVWSREGTSFPRPDWAKDNFFTRFTGTKLLDIAPAHGHHGLLLFRDIFKIPLQYHSCDMLPCYNKLLALSGIEVEYFNATHDSIAALYVESNFDLVTCTEFLEHLRDSEEERLLSGFKDITAKECKVLITFPEVALTRGGVPDVEPFGHVRQPNVDQVMSRLGPFTLIEHGKFRSKHVNQVYLIAEHI